MIFKKNGPYFSRVARYGQIKSRLINKIIKIKVNWIKYMSKLQYSLIKREKVQSIKIEQNSVIYSIFNL